MSYVYRLKSAYVDELILCLLSMLNPTIWGSTESYILWELRYITASGGWKITIHGTWYNSIFFRNKTFFFVKIENWNFQQLFDREFREILQNFRSFRWTFRKHFSMGNKSCPNELKFCDISQKRNEIDAENFRFLSWQTKKFYS